MNHAEIARRFNRSVGARHGAVLVGGAAEPLYVPATAARPAQIRYTKDYAQSALHELAHWCIAGAARRALPDYGYWYQPPPRDPAARAEFLAVESRVQGLERLFARAAAVRFHVSLDDPGSEPGDFANRVVAAGADWLANGLPVRTREVLRALSPDWEARVATLHG